MTPGFLVIGIVAMLLIVVPSALLALGAWQKGGIIRVLALCCAAAIFGLSVTVILGTSSSQWEENALLVLVAWAFLFVVAGSLAAIGRLFRGRIKR